MIDRGHGQGAAQALVGACGAGLDVHTTGVLRFERRGDDIEALVGAEEERALRPDTQARVDLERPAGRERADGDVAEAEIGAQARGEHAQARR